MASQAEISEAVDVAREAGCTELLLLHCVSGYPTPAEQINLRRIPALGHETGLPIGLSDHTLGVEVAVAAVAMGACLIEKHFTLARAHGGPDAAFSLEPEEFSKLTQGAASAFAALGDGSSARPAVETGNMAFRRSLYVVKDVRQGESVHRREPARHSAGLWLATKTSAGSPWPARPAGTGARHASELGCDRVAWTIPPQRTHRA